MTRTLAGRFRPRFLLISQLLIGAVVLTPFGLQADFPVPDVPLLVLLLISAVGSAVGNFLLVMASRTAEASLIAPLVYSQLISATALGIVVFGEWPDLVSLAGLVLIAISGLGSLLVHQRAGRGRYRPALPAHAVMSLDVWNRPHGTSVILRRRKDARSRRLPQAPLRDQSETVRA